MTHRYGSVDSARFGTDNFTGVTFPQSAGRVFLFFGKTSPTRFAIVLEAFVSACCVYPHLVHRIIRAEVAPKFYLWGKARATLVAVSMLK